jgi:hypothetical protein
VADDPVLRAVREASGDGPPPPDVAGIPAGDDAFGAQLRQVVLQRQARAAGVDLSSPSEILSLDNIETVQPTNGLARTAGWIRELMGDPARLKDVQKRMFAAGFYPSGTEPVWGQMDAATVEAIRRFTNDAELLTDTDEDGTVFPLEFDDALAIMTRGLAAVDGPVAEASLADDPIAVSLQDPQTLIGVLEQAYAAAGKRPGPDDKRAFIAAFHTFQRDQALAERRFAMQVEQGGPGEMVEFQQSDPNAQAQQFAREQLGDTPFIGQEAIGIVDTLSNNLGPA